MRSLTAPLACFAVALAVRSVHLAAVWDTPLLENYVTDLEIFLFYAEKILAHTFFFIIPSYGSVFYGLYLAPFIALFGDFAVHAAVIVQVLLDSVSAAFICILAGFFAQSAGSGRLASWLAGLAYAVYGPLVFYAALPLGESLAIFFMLAALTLLSASQKEDATGLPALLAGVCIGLMLLLRPNNILFLPLIPAVLWWWAEDRAVVLRKTFLLLLIGALLPLLPMAVHNHAAAGKFSPFGLQGGLNFYMGNNPDASGLYDGIPGITNKPFIDVLDSIKVASAAEGRELTPPEANSWWLARGLSFWQEQPLAALQLLGTKIALFCNNREWPLNLDYTFCQRFSPLLAFLPAGFGVFAALAMAGLCAPRKSDAPRRAARLGQAATLATAVGVVLFFVSARYRIPTAALVMAWAGVGVAALWAAARGGRWKTVLRTAAPAVPVLILAFLPPHLFGQEPASLEASNQYTLAKHYAQTDKLEQSLASYDASLQLRPEWWSVRLEKAGVLDRMDRKDEALQALERAASDAPETLNAAAALAHREFFLRGPLPALCRLEAFGPEAREITLYTELRGRVDDFSPHMCPTGADP